jgi:predicted nucleic acid-binding protein
LILYLDSSALVKVYAEEQWSEVSKRTADAADLVASSLLAYVEVRSAFARKMRSGKISQPKLEQYKNEFERDWTKMNVLAVDDPTVARAGDLAETYGLRGFDAVHLASANILATRFGKVTFACFDTELSRAASACGMALLSLD